MAAAAVVAAARGILSVRMGEEVVDMGVGVEEGVVNVVVEGLESNAARIAQLPSPTGAGTACQNVKIALKFLLSNVAAGIVIGKAGTNITELQEISGARIQLSRNNVFYPGTVERVLLLTGTVKSVLVALFLILAKLTGRGKWSNGVVGGEAGSPGGEAGGGGGLGGPEEEVPREEEEDEAGGAGSDREGDVETTQVKIVMPAAVCGAIIGKGGETIRHFAEDSGASISVSPQERVGRLDRMGSVVNDRIVTVTGTVPQILRAVALVVTVVAEDPNYVKNVGLSVNYAPRPGSSGGGGGFPGSPAQMTGFPPGPGGPAAPAGFPTNFPPPKEPLMHPPQPHPAPPMANPPFSTGFLVRATSALPGGRAEVKLAVPDEHVGAIIGKGGEILAQLQGLVGVKVMISGRGEFEPGTRNRTVSISGPHDAVQIAQLLVTQKVNDRIAQLHRQGAL